MRQITRCPACGTLFRVVADQLKISDGWVRCGHCSEVFDAPSHFFDENTVPAVPHPTDAVGSSPSAPPDAVDALADEALPAEPVDDPEVMGSASAEPFEPAGHAEPVSGPQPPALADESVAADVSATSMDADTALPTEPPAEIDDRSPPATQARVDVEPDATDEPDAITTSGLQAWRLRREAEVQADADALEQAVDGQPDEPVADDVDAPAPGDAAHADVTGGAPGPASETGTDIADADDTPPTPAFVRQAERRAFWRQPRVRALMSLLVLALVGVLGGQLIYVERDRIAAHAPAARPLLEQACKVLGCEVGALRQIEAVLVEGSSFTRLRPDTYRLGLVLRSSAGVDIAMPSVELTLTSVQGQILLRRVLSPSDMGASATLGANSEWVADLPLTLDDPQVASRVSGYTVLPFYP